MPFSLIDLDQKTCVYGCGIGFQRFQPVNRSTDRLEANPTLTKNRNTSLRVVLGVLSPAALLRAVIRLWIAKRRLIRS